MSVASVTDEARREWRLFQVLILVFLVVFLASLVITGRLPC